MKKKRKAATAVADALRDYYQIIGRNIVQARHAKCLTQDRLKVFLHIHRSAVAAMEAGIRRPQLHELAVLNDVLDLSIDKLTRGTRTPSK